MTAENKTLVAIFMAASVLICGVVGFFALGSTSPNRVRYAETEVAQIDQFLDSYRAFQGEYPERLEQLVDPPGGMSPVTQEIPVDPWGNPYWYRRLTDSSHELCSMGKDGRFSDDDIFPPHTSVDEHATITEAGRRWLRLDRRRCGGRS